mgnify:FL=1|jgi:hypothetical protein
MQTRTITVDYARPRGYDVGYRAENNFTLLALPVPEELEGADSYRVYFESTVGEYLQTELLTPVDGYVTVKITSDVVPEPGNMAAQLVAFADGEKVGYAPMITGSAKVSIPDGTERLSHSLAAEIALNTAARHGHDNKSVIDLLTADDTGTLLYDGKVIGGEGSTAEDISYTLSEDVQTTFPDIELESDTVKSGLDVAMYYALAGMFAKYISCNLQSGSGETVSMDLQRILDGFVFPAMFKAHEHDNKSVLDLISAVDGKLRYNGSDVGLKGEKGDKGEPGTPGAPGVPGSDATVTKNNVVAALGYTPQAVSAQVTAGTEITLADNTEYRLENVATLTLTYPMGNFECWLKLTFAASGSITVTLPTGTKYIGNAPNFASGETWELSFKDKVLAAQKVGEGV